jgi:hypothetical protein
MRFHRGNYTENAWTPIAATSDEAARAR